MDRVGERLALMQCSLCFGHDARFGRTIAILRYVQMELAYMTAPTVIPLPANANSSPSVKGVNDRDQVILQVGLDSDVARSYVWTAGRPLQVLEPLPGFLHSAAQDINSAGLVVGISTAGAVESVAATLWRGGQTCELRDLVTTPGLQGRQWSDAFRVRWRLTPGGSRVRAVAPIGASNAPAAQLQRTFDPSHASAVSTLA